MVASSFCHSRSYFSLWASHSFSLIRLDSSRHQVWDKGLGSGATATVWGLTQPNVAAPGVRERVSFPSIILKNSTEASLSQFGSHSHLWANQWSGNMKILLFSPASLENILGIYLILSRFWWVKSSLAVSEGWYLIVCYSSEIRFIFSRNPPESSPKDLGSKDTVTIWDQHGSTRKKEKQGSRQNQASLNGV